MSNRTISDVDTPDPWMVAANSLFYLTFTLGNRIEIWSSPSMESFHSTSPDLRKATIWQPAPGSPWSRDIWAPELHWLDNRWYIYTCGSPPDVGNPGHRTTVLRCATGERDPMDPTKWEFLGPLKGMRGDQWSIDATVFYAPTRNSQRGDDLGLYCCYSGWPLGDTSDTQQDLFLVRMKNPEEAEEGSLVCISKAELEWERPDGGRRGVNEGPTWLDMPGFRGIVYSAHGSWTSEYKLGILQLVEGGDPLDTGSWRKRPTPLLVSDKSMGGPFGPGHASFVKDPTSGATVYCIYHGTEKEGEGWANRKARVLAKGPECFDMNARPLCCGHRSQIAVGSGQIGGSSQQYPGQTQQIPPAAPGGHSGGGLGTKIGSEVEKRIPPQYKGVFNKAKKLFG